MGSATELPEIPQFPQTCGGDAGVDCAGPSPGPGHRLPARIAGYHHPLAARHQPRRVLESSGMVPHEDDVPQSAGIACPSSSFRRRTSMMAEQLRQVRTRLQHSSSLDTTRSILVTSPSPGDGKSTIACNLAAGLAINGRRTPWSTPTSAARNSSSVQPCQRAGIFRRPEQPRFIRARRPGNAGSQPCSCCRVATSRPTPPNWSKASCSSIPSTRCEEFDHVIFDSGPLLFVSETVALALASMASSAWSRPHQYPRRSLAHPRYAAAGQGGTPRRRPQCRPRTGRRILRPKHPNLLRVPEQRRTSGIGPANILRLTTRGADLKSGAASFLGEIRSSVLGVVSFLSSTVP